MKRGTPNHPKMTDLAAELEIPIYAAAGIMEMLWHFTDEYAIQGDIGKHTDVAIAKAVGWEREPSELIEALIITKWLDQCPERRLLVHDWKDHCNDYCHKRLKRSGLTVYEVSKNVQTIPENFGLRARGGAWLGDGKKTESGLSKNVQTIPDIERIQEIADGFDRHRKHSNWESRDNVIQTVMGMNGTFDVEKFRARHRAYCDHHDSENDWKYTNLTFLGWIRAGMPEPEPKANPVLKKPDKCPRCEQKPCICFEKHMAVEESRAGK